MSLVNDAEKGICLAIGGPSGSGKSAVIKLLKNHFGDRVCQSVPYTTRSPRQGEINGVHYHFVDPTELSRYWSDPRYANFTSARGHWYWIDLVKIKETLNKKTDSVYLTVITQTEEFAARKLIFPGLRWIWLLVSNHELTLRLEERGDSQSDIASSLSHNRMLASQDRSGLVSLEISNSGVSPQETANRIINFLENF